PRPRKRSPNEALHASPTPSDQTRSSATTRRSSPSLRYHRQHPHAPSNPVADADVAPVGSSGNEIDRLCPSAPPSRPDDHAVSPRFQAPSPQAMPASDHRSSSPRSG